MQNNVVGVATGVVIDDELCQKLKLSRSMFAYGMKVAAVSILCQDARVWDAMTDAGTPCPARGSIGAEAAQYWTDNPDEIQDGSKYKTEYVQANKSEPHPIIAKHPESGADTIFGTVGYIHTIEGMSQEDSQQLIMDLYAWQTREEFQYTHVWQPNMLVMWDNRSVLHKATGGYDGYERLLHRTTIGDPRTVAS